MINADVYHVRLCRERDSRVQGHICDEKSCDITELIGNDDLIMRRLSELSPCEQITLLLTYSLRRRDVGTIKKRLLRQFLTCRGILDADYESLIAVRGMNCKTAVLIVLVGMLAREYETEIINDQQLTYENAGTFVAQQLGRRQTECLLIACLDAKYRLLRKRIVSGGTSVAVAQRDIAKLALACDAASILIAHNHPRGTPMPSVRDIDEAARIKKLLTDLRINLYDFIIVGEGGETYSVLHGGLV